MRIHTIAKAQKAPGKCYRCGEKIKKGQQYFWIKGMKTPKKVFCARHRPRPSEMTGSDKLAQLYAAREAVEDTITNDVGRDDLAQALRDAADTARDVGQEYQDSKSNLPDSLQQSATGDALEEKADGCEAWAAELESAADEIEAMEDWDAKAAEEVEEATDEAVDDVEDFAHTKALAHERAEHALGSLEI